MGKHRNNYRFPQGLNGVERLFHPFLHPHPQANPNDIKGSGYVENYASNMYSSTDIFGSYTGITEDGSMPIQDADDL